MAYKDKAIGEWMAPCLSAKGSVKRMWQKG